MLQLEPGTEFEILMPDLNNMVITDMTYNTDSIYSIASEVLPRLKSINFELQASKKQYAISKGNISPSLVAGGSIYTGFYNVISDASLKQDPYTTQLKNNNSQSLNLTLNSV